MEQHAQRELWKRLQIAIQSHSQLHDTELARLIALVKAEKEAIQNEQQIARLIFRDCFSENTKNVYGIKQKFRDLATYCKDNKLYHDFAAVVAASVIREWETPILSDLPDGPDGPLIHKYWDRAPLYLAIKMGDTRTSHPTYTLRVLAMGHEDVGQFFFRAEAQTELLTEEDNKMVANHNSYVVELQRQGKNDPRSNAWTPDRKRTATGTRGAAVKLSRSQSTSTVNSAPDGSNTFVTGFDHCPKNKSYQSEPECIPADRSRDSFIHERTDTVAFAINNIAVVAPNRSNVCVKYELRTSLFLAFYFGDTNQLLYVNLSLPEKKAMLSELPPHHLPQPFAPVSSMPFEASKNASVHWEHQFPMIWSILRTYHEGRGAFPDPLHKGEASYLYWIHVKEFLAHYISTQLNVECRSLNSSEMRTLQRMILCMRLYQFNEDHSSSSHKYKTPWVLEQISRDRQREIEASFFGDPLDDSFQRGDFTSRLNVMLGSFELNDNFRVEEADIGGNKCINMTTQMPTKTSFNLYKWMHGVADTLSGPYLHHAASRMSVRLFNRNLISLRSHWSTRRIMDEFLKRMFNENFIMIRFDDRAESTLTFDFYDTTSMQRSIEAKMPSITPADWYNGSINAKTIKETRFLILIDKSSKKSLHFCDMAVRDGVIDKKGGEASGLFAFLRSAYPAQFRKIVEVGDSDDRKKANVKMMYRREGAEETDDPPMYDFDFVPQPKQEGEINPVQGPAPDIGDDTSPPIDAITLADSIAGVVISPRPRLQPQPHVVNINHNHYNQPVTHNTTTINHAPSYHTLQPYSQAQSSAYQMQSPVSTTAANPFQTMPPISSVYHPPVPHSHHDSFPPTPQSASILSAMTPEDPRRSFAAYENQNYSTNPGSH